MHRWRTHAGIAGLILWLLTSAVVRSEVGDPTLRTDHPHYAGEGAFQTIEDCATFATVGHRSKQEQALAMYQWLLTHQWHLHSPQEPNVPGESPDTQRADQYDLMVFDANRARFSYGYGLCGTVHAWNEPYWRALGRDVRRRAFPGHVNSEIEYGGSWHAFDTDMAGLLFRRDGVVAGYDDIVRDPTLIDNARPPIPCYPFDWPNDFRTMQRGWQQVAKGGSWYKMYHSGYAAHPGIVRLRSGETFTRYFDRDHFGGPSRRRFWHHLPGGPNRNWTFAFNGTPRHDGAESNSRGQVSYANGEFLYRPDLSRDSFREGVVAASDNVASRMGSPRLHSRDGKAASCTFHHFAPYVICGDPADDANPMTGPATGGLVLSGIAVGQVDVELSIDQGQSWEVVGELRDAFTVDLTDRVKGRYGWQIRFQWSASAGLDELSFATVTQVCPTIYPCLKPGGTQVVYRCASRGVVPLLPNFSLPEEALSAVENRRFRSEQVRYSPRTRQSRFAYQTGNRPAQIAFQVTTPQDLMEVTAAARFGIRVPPPAGSQFELDFSTNDGQSWQTLGIAAVPMDNEYSSGWVYGRGWPATPTARQATVRVKLDAGGYPTGLIEMQAYAIYRTPSPQPLTVTYAWKENGELKTHREAIPAGVVDHPFRVATGEQIEDVFVRLTVE